MAYQTEMLPEDIWVASHVIFYSPAVSEMGPVSYTWTQLTQIVQSTSFGLQHYFRLSLIWFFRRLQIPQMHRLKYGLLSIHWMNSSWWSFDCISLFSIFFPILRNTSTRDFEEKVFQSSFQLCFFAQDADTKGERANKPVRTKAPRFRPPINGWNLKDKTDKSFRKACSRILLLRKNCFFLRKMIDVFFSSELLRNCLVADELESWGQFQSDIRFHWLKIAS